MEVTGIAVPPCTLPSPKAFSLTPLITRRGHWRIEERRYHGTQPIAALHQRRVSGAGKDGEPRIRQAREVPHHAAAEQTEHLHSVLGADDVGITNDEQGGRAYGRHVI